MALLTINKSRDLIINSNKTQIQNSDMEKLFSVEILSLRLTVLLNASIFDAIFCTFDIHILKFC